MKEVLSAERLEDSSFVRSYQHVVRRTSTTLEYSEIFLGRERRATAGGLAARDASRPNLLARRGLHICLGLLSRPVRGSLLAGT
jgi:hypothetical protein